MQALSHNNHICTVAILRLWDSLLTYYYASNRRIFVLVDIYLVTSIACIVLFIFLKLFVFSSTTLTPVKTQNLPPNSYPLNPVPFNTVKSAPFFLFLSGACTAKLSHQFGMI